MRWKVTDPLGNEIFLKNSTYTEHILGDHEDKDKSYRKMLEPLAIQTLIDPRYIVKDGKRRLYYDLIVAEKNPLKLRILKVVVDFGGEVVTWTTLRKGDSIFEGGIIYDSISGK